MIEQKQGASRLEQMLETKQVASTVKIAFALPPTDALPRTQYGEREVARSFIGNGPGGVFIDDRFTASTGLYLPAPLQDLFGYTTILAGHGEQPQRRVLILSDTQIPLDPDVDNLAPDFQQFYERFVDAEQSLYPLPVFDQKKPEHWEVLDGLMREKSRMMKKAREHERATTRRYKRLAFHDDNTELPNRRAYHDRFVENVKYAIKNNMRLNVGAADAIGFKEHNDRYGQQEGDLIINQLGAALRKIMRPGDQLYRIGGDEFRIVTFGGDPSPLKQRLETAVPASPMKVTDASGNQHQIYLRGIDVAFESRDVSRYSDHLPETELYGIFNQLDRKADASMHKIKDDRKAKR